MTPQTHPFDELALGPLRLRNRLIKSATNEGMAPGGTISDSLIEFHRRIAGGGVAMSTLAYCAVSADGRTFVDQVELKRTNLSRLRQLTEAVHREGAASCAQITHGGAFTFLPKLIEHPRPISADSGLNPPGIMAGRWLKRAASESELARLCDEFVMGARLAREAGFDAVEIHLGHGYLLSQFLSPAYNHRRDQYGGDASARIRFPRMVTERVLEAVGKDMAVICKLSIDEGHRRGSSPADVTHFCQQLEAAGAHLLVLSAGMNVEAPWTIFGSPLPMRSMTAAARGIFKLLSAGMALRQPRTAFAPLYLLEQASQIRQHLSMPLCYVGGVTSLDHAQKLCDAGFDAMAMGRALIHQPDLIANWQSDQPHASSCTACNLCVAEMYSARGTHCVLTDAPVPSDLPAAIKLTSGA